MDRLLCGFTPVTRSWGSKPEPQKIPSSLLFVRRAAARKLIGIESAALWLNLNEGFYVDCLMILRGRKRQLLEGSTRTIQKWTHVGGGGIGSVEPNRCRGSDRRGLRSGATGQAQHRVVP